jgi:hypothetical protein
MCNNIYVLIYNKDIVMIYGKKYEIFLELQQHNEMNSPVFPVKFFV